MYIVGIDIGKNHHEASIDSFLIAEVIRFGQFTTTSMADENILAMWQLCRVTGW